jgi:hypothetical protein
MGMSEFTIPIRLPLYLFVILSLAGCGVTESEDASPHSIFKASNGGESYLRALPPQYLAFDRSTIDPTLLIPVTRILPFNQYDALIEPQLSSDQTVASSVVTGIGIEARDRNNLPLQIRLGILARQFDPNTGTFGSATRVFSAPGEDLTGSQAFYTTTTITFMTGLGVRLRDGDVTLLQIQRKSLERLGRDGVMLDASKKVILDNGWAAIGFQIRFMPNNPADRAPFLQDVLAYIADLAHQ